MNFLSFFNTKTATAICLTLAIANRVINVLYVSFAGRDKMTLVLQSKSFLQGKGLSIPHYFTSNMDTPFYDFTPYWPPGYSILLAPFLKIFNYNIYWSTTTLDILVCLALIFVVRKICKQIGFAAAATNIMTLVAGCFEYSFINASLPTDTVSLLFLLAGISMTLHFVSSNYISPVSLVLTGLLLFLPCFFRYLYPPVSLMIPLLILFAGFIRKDRVLKKKGGGLFCVTLVLLLSFFLVLKNATGYAGYATPTPRGLFPENIVNWYPMAPGSFININFFLSQVYKFTAIGPVPVMRILELINVVVLVYLTLLFFHKLIFKKIFSELTPYKWFLLLGFFASAAVFVSLGYLSFTYDVIRGHLNNWTYVYESRYFAFVTVFLQLSFWGWISHSLSWQKTKWIRVFIFLPVVMLFIELTHNIYFHSKVAFNFSAYKSAVYREQDYSYFISLIDTLKKERPGVEIISASSGDTFYPYITAFMGGKGIFDAVNLNKQLPAVKKKTILLLAVYDSHLDIYDPFLSKNNARLLHHVAYTNYYLLELNP